jgi:probable rRNA maturation factor
VLAVDERADGEGDEVVDLDRWAGLAEAVLAGEGVGGAGELSLLFVGEDRMAELNERYLGETGPTDVLSFPLDADEAPEPARLLGDVVICPAVAARNAPGHAGSFEDELALLVVHGVLHVLGMDHAEADEAAAMRERERFHLARAGVTTSP